MSRILPRFYRQQLATQDTANITRILNETPTNPEPTQTVSRATLPGDRRRLRGIPVVGGVGGTSPGTDPLKALLAKEPR